MAKSNIKYELAETKRPNFFRQHVPELRNQVNKYIPFWSENLLTFLPILSYFVLSIGISYNKLTVRTWEYPLGAIVCNIYINFGISGLLRCILQCYNGQKRVTLSWKNMILSVIPPGIASGFDIGLSNWAITMLVIPVSIMTESTTIVFVFAFSLLFQLEKKSWSLTGIIIMISVGLTMFVYQSTELNRFGIFIALLASFFHGFRMTMIQHVMQKSKLGLENAIDMMYYIQPWMLLSTLPIALWFEGAEMYNSMFRNWLDRDTILMITMTILSKSLIGFCLELAQLMIISRTSSLTLCIAETFKMLFMILLIFECDGILISNINYFGLLTCFSGIILYGIVRPWTTTIEENKEIEKNKEIEENYNSVMTDKSKIVTTSDIFDNEKWTNEKTRDLL